MKGARRLGATLVLGGALAASLVVACSKPEDKPDPSAAVAATAAPEPSVAAEAPSASAAASVAAPAASVIPAGENPEAEIPTEEDFEEAAARRIDADNLEAEFDAIEQELSADS